MAIGRLADADGVAHDLLPGQPGTLRHQRQLVAIGEQEKENPGDRNPTEEVPNDDPRRQPPRAKRAEHQHQRADAP